MENKNLNFKNNIYISKENENKVIKQNKSYNGLKLNTGKINYYSSENCKNMENGNSSPNNLIKSNNLNIELNLLNLIKENQSLQNELKLEKSKKQEDNKKINMLKKTINNLFTEEDKNKINNKLNANFNVLNKKIRKNNKITYADILINAENILQENNALKSEKIKFSKIQNENSELKNKLKEKEEALNDLIANNIDLEKKLEKSENKISKLYEKLKDFQKFEEIKLINDSLNKNLKSKNEEILGLNAIMKEKDKEINDLKCMKYDNKLFILEQELNECKLEETKYANEIIKIKSDLNNTKKNLEIKSDLLEQSQKTITKSRLNLETTLSKYNNLKNEYNSLKNTNNEIIIENSNLKKQNSKFNKELKELREFYLKYKEEINEISNQFIKIKDEKEKNEIYYLDKISSLQKEKNHFEKNFNEIKDKYVFSLNLENLLNNNIDKNINDNNNEDEINYPDKYNEKYWQKKYEIAINEINSYNSDNKKLFALSKNLKNELNLITEEKNFYIKIINKLIEGKYIDSKYDKLVNAIKKSIENFLEIQNMSKNKFELEQKLIKYEKILKNMNKKIESGQTGKFYEINKNFYDVDDFSEIAKIQNQLMNINDKLNSLYENKINIKKALELY